MYGQKNKIICCTQVTKHMPDFKRQNRGRVNVSQNIFYVNTEESHTGL